MQKQTREHKKKGKAVKIGYGKITIENTLRVAVAVAERGKYNERNMKEQGAII